MLKYKSLYLKGGSANELFPFDEENRRYFNRIACAVVWPSAQPGCAVVLGDEMSKERRYHWLAEHFDHDLGNLLRRCLELKSQFKISDFFARPDEVVLFFLDTFNADNRKRGISDFHFSEVPFCDGSGRIGYHLNVLRELLRPGNKRLILSESSVLPGQISSLPQGIGDVFDNDQPGPAALSYCTSVFEVYPYRPNVRRQKTEYDVLSYR